MLFFYEIVIKFYPQIIEKVISWIYSIIYKMNKEEQVAFLQEPVFKKVHLIKIAEELLSWDGEIQNPYLKDVYDEHLNEIRNSEAYKLIMPLYKKHREKPLTIEERRKILLDPNDHYSDYLIKLIRENFPGLTNQEVSELKHNIEKIYRKEK